MEETLKYLLDNLFIASLQTIAFFIVAVRYDKIQKQREFLRHYEEIFVFGCNYIKKESVAHWSSEAALLIGKCEREHIFKEKDMQMIHSMFLEFVSRNLVKEEDIMTLLREHSKEYQKQLFQLEKRIRWFQF